MSFTFRAVATTTSGASPRVPSNPALEGDLLIAQVSSSGSDVTPTVPAGFVEVTAARNTTVPTVRIYWKIETASPPATYSFSFPSGSGHTVGLMAWSFTVGNTVDVDAAGTQSNGAGDRIFPSVVTTLANDLLTHFAALGNTGSTPPAGSTERWDTGSSPRMFSMTEIEPDIGATGTRTATGTASANQASTVAFKEVVPVIEPAGGAVSDAYHMFLLAPEVAFAAQVNQTAFSYPLSEVVYDSVTTGAYTDIDVGMTLYVGTSPGLRDLGAQRIRTLADATKIYFGRSSQGVRPGEMKLSNNVYLTVVKLFEVWARPPFIDSDGTVSKDPGLAVEWRNTTPPPVCNIGCGFARTIDPSTSLITVALDATGSYVTVDGATITTYLWDVDDGTIVTGTTATSTITVTFPAGFRYVKCTVTDSEGHSSSMRIPIFAHDPNNDITIPFQFVSHQISREGQRITVRPLKDILVTTYPPGTLAMIWKREPVDVFDRSHMVLPSGWLGEVPASVNAQREGTLKNVELELLDVAGRLQRIHAFSQRVEDDSIRVARNTATGKSLSHSWLEIVDLNMDKYIHYLLAWHSSALALADFFWSGTGAIYAATGLESDGDSFWSQMTSRVEQMVPLYHLTCDRLGALRMLPDPLIQEVASRVSTIQADLEEDDWSDIRYTNRRHPRTYWLKTGAVKAGAAEVALIASQISSGLVVTPTTYFSRAPGEAPGQGEGELTDNIGIAVSQDTLNKATGHQYARINAFESEFRVTLTGGDDLGIDPALMEWVKLTTPAGRRGLQLTAERMLPKEIYIRYNQSREGLTKSIEVLMERETIGVPAVTYIPPQGDVDSDDDTWPGDYTGTPPGDVGAPPAIPPLPLYDGQNVVAIFDEYGQIFRTSNFQNSTPTWDRKTLAGLGGSEKVLSFVVDPFSPLYRNTGTTVNAFIATERYVYKVNDIFGTTPTITQLHSFGYVTNPDLDRNRMIQASFGRFFSEETDNPWIVVVSHNGTLLDHEGTKVLRSTDGGQTWQGEVGISANSDPETGEFREPYIGVYLSPKTPGLAYSAGYLPTAPIADGYVSTDWGATWAQITNPDINPDNGLGGDYHVPWPDNDAEDIVYHGRWEKAAALHYKIYRVDGTTKTDISPSHGGETYGVNRSHFAVRTFDNDRRYVALAGIANGTTNSFVDDVFAAFVSSNYGDTWVNIVNTLIKTDPHPEHIAFAADTEQVLYLWGTERYIAYSTNFGTTIQDKSGNMPTDFPTDIRDIVGLVGGEAPP